MKKNGLLTVAGAALFLVTVGVSSSFANSGTPQTDHGSSDHHTFSSGKEYGQHVSGHAKSVEGKGGLGRKGFSGDHNHGNHKGFSSIKAY